MANSSFQTACFLLLEFEMSIYLPQLYQVYSLLLIFYNLHKKTTFGTIPRYAKQPANSTANFHLNNF
jgi:hypothetical protein